MHSWPDPNANHRGELDSAFLHAARTVHLQLTQEQFKISKPHQDGKATIHNKSRRGACTLSRYGKCTRVQ